MSLNHSRFDVITEALDSCSSIREQLDSIDKLNSSLNEQHVVKLIDNIDGLSATLKETRFGSDYGALLDECPNLENIVNSIPKLDQYIDDPDYYNKAIELLELIENVHKKYGHQIPSIREIYSKSEIRKEHFILKLSNKLENLKNPTKAEVLSLVNHLARCGNFTGRELRLKYLQARDNWFNNKCEAKTNSFDDVVGVYCSGLPTIFKEYKEIFNDSCLAVDRKYISYPGGGDVKEDGAIINSWLMLKASIFISSLEVYLKTIDQNDAHTPSMICDTLEKCFELTNWLATIGFDFSAQVSPLFYRTCMREVKESVDKATESFEVSFSKLVSMSIESLLLPVDDEILRISNSSYSEQLPKSIDHYPIFKVYCLHVIESLRWIQSLQKFLSPICLCTETYAALNSSMTRVMKALSAILNMDNNAKHPILTRIAISFVTEVLAFFTDYCEKLFPERVVLATIGLSKQDYKALFAKDPERLRNFRLDLKQIAEPLKTTIPSLLQTIET